MHSIVSSMFISARLQTYMKVNTEPYICIYTYAFIEHCEVQLMSYLFVIVNKLICINKIVKSGQTNYGVCTDTTLPFFSVVISSADRILALRIYLYIAQSGIIK